MSSRLMSCLVCDTFDLITPCPICDSPICDSVDTGEVSESLVECNRRRDRVSLVNVDEVNHMK